MERRFVALSLDNEEEEVVQVQRGPNPVSEKKELCLLNGFKFYRMDLERVLKGSLWTFNRHLLLVHHLEDGEDSLKVSLIFSNFWVQIHDVPPGYFSEALTRQMGDFIGKFLEYDGANLGRGVQNHLRIRIQMDVRRHLRRKKRGERREAKWGNNYEGTDLGRRKKEEEIRGGLKVERIHSNLQGRVDMDQDSVMCVMEGGDGKKRPRRESDRSMEGKEVGSLVNKRATWEMLRNLSRSQGLSWMVCGDFNEIFYSFKKVGGIPREEKRMAAFRDVLDEYQLMDVDLRRGGLRRRLVWMRLDDCDRQVESIS
ncbi:hypothetical protein Gotur_034431 [Gossypium turneri]